MEYELSDNQEMWLAYFGEPELTDEEYEWNFLNILYAEEKNVGMFN